MIAGIIIILLILTPSVIAQVNTEKMRMGLSESGFSGDINFSYSVNMGNSELTKIGLAPNFVFRSGKNQLFMLNDLDRVYDEEGSIINKAFTHLRYNYEFTDKFILEMFVQAQYNRSTNLDHRYLAGTGIRIIPIEQESFLMAVGLTGMHEDEELEGGESTKIIRGSSYLYLK
ncbi:MAG: DUF481 domain-containing protein, partial [candidate division Zixibacteria bacterium]|nr:DUF481 domain-containing protein [candidate division Zixibacteria bacterium]